MATSEEKTIFLYILLMVDKVKTKIIISFRKVSSLWDGLPTCSEGWMVK